MTSSWPSPSRSPSQVWPPGDPTEPPARAKRSSPAAPETITSSPPLVTASGSPSPSTRSEEHTSELQSLMRISYAVFCLKKKQKTYARISEAHTLKLYIRILHYLSLSCNKN